MEHFLGFGLCQTPKSHLPVVLVVVNQRPVKTVQTVFSGDKLDFTSKIERHLYWSQEKGTF